MRSESRSTGMQAPYVNALHSKPTDKCCSAVFAIQFQDNNKVDKSVNNTADLFVEGSSSLLTHHLSSTGVAAQVFGRRIWPSRGRRLDSLSRASA